MSSPNLFYYTKMNTIIVCVCVCVCVFVLMIKMSSHTELWGKVCCYDFSLSDKTIGEKNFNILYK